MKQGDIEKPKKVPPATQFNLDFRTNEEARQSMLQKIREGRIGDLDKREEKLWQEQREQERQDDVPRYGH